MPDLTATAIEQISWLKAGKISSSELLEAYIVHEAETNPALNAIIAKDLDAARKAAKTIDERRARGEDIGFLQGLPMSIKDTYDVTDMPAVCGNPALTKRAPGCEDAFVVKLVRNADGVIWGKTNSPFMGGDVQTYNKVFGVTNNPHNTAHTPGGSSGGAAAALASNMTPLEIGSDIGGSLRTPAHYSGVYALKTTHGLVSLDGHVPPPPGVVHDAFDLAVAGPMARNVEDLKLLMSIIAPQAKSAPDTFKSLSDVKVAVWDKEAAFPLGKDCAGAVAIVENVLAENKANISKAKPDIDGEHLIETYIRLLAPIILGDAPKPVLGAFKLFRPILHAIGQKTKYSFAMIASRAVQSASAFNKATADRNAMKAECERFFNKWDVLIAPVTATPALEHNNKGAPFGRSMEVDGKTVPYFHQLDWIALATTCHLPSISIPVTKTEQGLPIGVQIIGAEGEDLKVLEIAQLIEAAMKNRKTA